MRPDVSMRDEPVPPRPPRGHPTSELLLAQALDACLRAERRRRGSSEDIIAHAPAASRAELQRLVQLAGALERVAAEGWPSAEFRSAARARLLQRIGGEVARPPLPGPHLSPIGGAGRAGRRSDALRWRWLWRGGAGLLAAAVAVGATLTASANALPGDPLYSLKTFQEELNVRLAADDQARVLSMLQRADARLDETSRLLAEGRTDDAVVTTQRYDQAVDRATTTYVVSLEGNADSESTSAPMEARLSQAQDRLQAILADAPEPARADLRQALVTTERGRELVADPQPVERALGRRPSGPPPVAAAEPTLPPPTPVPSPTTPPAEPTQAPVVEANAPEASSTTPEAVAGTPASPTHADEPPATTVPRNGGSNGRSQANGRDQAGRTGQAGDGPAAPPPVIAEAPGHAGGAAAPAAEHGPSGGADRADGGANAGDGGDDRGDGGGGGDSRASQAPAAGAAHAAGPAAAHAAAPETEAHAAAPEAEAHAGAPESSGHRSTGGSAPGASAQAGQRPSAPQQAEGGESAGGGGAAGGAGAASAGGGNSGHAGHQDNGGASAGHQDGGGAATAGHGAAPVAPVAPPAAPPPQRPAPTPTAPKHGNADSGGDPHPTNGGNGQASGQHSGDAGNGTTTKGNSGGNGQHTNNGHGGGH